MDDFSVLVQFCSKNIICVNAQKILVCGKKAKPASKLGTCLKKLNDISTIKKI